MHGGALLMEWTLHTWAFIVLALGLFGFAFYELACGGGDPRDRKRTSANEQIVGTDFDAKS